MKTAFITGVSRELGLGTALVRRYLGEGWTVFAASRNIDGEHLPALKQEWGDKFEVVALDVSDIKSVRAAADVIREKIGNFDVLISNATATNGDGNLPIDEGMDLEHMLNAYDVNAVGFLRMVQTFLPLCNEKAVLAAITSEQGSMGHCWRDSGADYGMAKAALNYACVVTQRRLGERGLRVLAIHPGWVQTRPAPPKADLTPEESADYIFKTIANPPPYVDKGNKGVYVNYDGTEFPF
ncbi:short-chain dehydrogenase [Clostridia bacterium]|nr:short-chain dehydrogenase [Clostridia bacterium]GHV35595.1 short-chain dehydrogenase [Clostridia bacterium]